MKMFFRCLLLLSCINLAFAASNNVLNHFIIKFDSGDSYETTLKNNTLTWKGLSGEDKNIVRKNQVKHIAFSKNVDVYQWTDEAGLFVTFILDKNNHSGIASSKDANNHEWFTKGKITAL